MPQARELDPGGDAWVGAFREALLSPGPTDDPWPEGKVPPEASLSALIRPLTPRRFASEHLGRRAHRGRGTAARLASAFSPEHARDALYRLWVTDRSRWDVRVDLTGAGRESATGTVLDVDYPELAGVLHAGGTVCISGIHFGSARLRAIASHVQRKLGWLGRVGFNCYISTAGRGFDTHFDARNVNTIQVAGSKTWIYSPTPAVEYPLRNSILQHGQMQFPGGGKAAAWEVQQPARRSEEVTLQAGDYFFLPAGAWHAARAQGTSVSLNLYLEHEPFWETVSAMIREEFVSQAPWRAGWPATDEPAHGGFGVATRDYLQARLEDLKTFVNGLDLSDPRLHEIYAARLARADSNLVRRRYPRPEGAIRKTTVLRVVAPIRVSARDGSETIRIFADGQRLTLPRTALALVLRLSQEWEFQAGDVTDWDPDGSFAWRDVKRLLDLLVVQGILAVR
jgi:hypothetical protein